MLVSGRKKVERKGPYFSDSDLFKWMEGAAWDLASYDDPKAGAELDRVIDEVVAAQQPDGYLNTFFQGELANQRFRNLPVEHELYCAGHMFQAAVAHYRVTGSDKFLNAATRYAESTDNPGVTIRDLELASDDFETSRSEILGGVVTIKGKGLTVDEAADRGPLYRPRGSGHAKPRGTPVTLIPYYAWANRGNSHMAVWLHFRK